MKGKICIILIMSLLLSVWKVDYVYASEEFAGYRKVICVIRQSDLNNFVSGGRNTLNTILTQNQEEWFTCEVLSDGHEVEISLEFTFDSYIDYEKKVAQLIGYKPITTYNENEFYMENFLPEELFHFIDVAMQNAEVVEEHTFCELLHLQNDSMELNGKEYQGTGAVNMSDESRIQYTDIEIRTERSENQYIRTVDLYFEDDEIEKTKKILEDRCATISAQWKESDNNHYKVEFNVDSEEKLIKNTMILLATAVNIVHDKYYKSDKLVRMSTKESIDIENVLTEDGEFYYVTEVPETYENLALQIDMETSKESENGTKITGRSVSYRGKEGVIEYYYDESFKFEKIQVMTDVSDELRKIKRTILFYQNRNLADDYHELIKEQLYSRMKRGDTLRIYDTNEYRCYEISYSSWFVNDVNLFTNRIFSIKNSELTLERSAIPFVDSEISDFFDIESGDMKSYSDMIEISYHVPDNTRTAENIVKDDMETNLKVVSEPNVSISSKFSALYYKKLFICMTIILLLILVLWAGLAKTRKKFKNWRARKSSVRKRQTSHIIYCPKCGNANQSKAKFCARCGNDLESVHTYMG